MTDTLYTLIDINSGHIKRHLTAAEAGRARADISEGSFAVVLGSYHGRDRIEDAIVASSPETVDGIEIWTVVSRDRSGVWCGTTCFGVGRSADEAWAKFAFILGAGHGHQGWHDVRGDVLTDQQYDEMIAELIAQDDVDALKCHAADERAGAYLDAREAE